MIQIDGSELEGGGQILRISVACSTIFNMPICISKIRAGRSKPGLKAQHLTGLQLTRDMCEGVLEGDSMNSLEVKFCPQKIKGGNYFADTQTAGSVSLLIQSTFPCALFGQQSSKLKLRGGTNADMAPQIDYTIEVFKKIALKFGVHFDVVLNVRGFFPMGRGEVELEVHKLKEPIKSILMLDQGNVLIIRGYSFVAGTLPIKMAHIMADSAEATLKDALGSHIEISIQRFKEPPSRAVGNGACIILWAETSTGCILGSSGLCKRGNKPENVGAEAADGLINVIDSKSCVDQYAQDQMIILMALADGKSRVRTSQLTLHTQTAIHIAKIMTKATFNIIEEPDHGTLIIECNGINAYGQYYNS